MPERIKGIGPKYSTAVTPIYKSLSKKFLLNAEFSDTPNTYLIGNDGLTYEKVKVETSLTYDEYHPLMAVGRAVIEFRDSYSFAHITYIKVQQKVQK